MKKLKINEEKFDNLNELSAYWLGFFAGDGTVVKRGNSYQITVGLAKKDKHHLGKLKSFLGSSHKIFKSRNNFIFTFRSLKIGSKLLDYGIIPNKSAGFWIKKRNLLLNRHFWRGLLDADGSLGVYNDKESLRLVGCYDILSQFFSYCKIVYPSTLNNKIRKHKNIFVIAFLTNTAKFFVKHFYENSSIFLERKKQIADMIIKYKRIDKRKGELNINSKLNQNKVNLIRRLADKKSQRELGRIFGVTHRTIQQILRYETWSYLAQEFTLPCK